MTATTTVQPAELEALKARFGHAVLVAYEDRGMPTVLVDKSRIRDILSFLKTEPGLEFDFLTDLAGADGLRLADWGGRWPDRFQVAYHLRSMKTGRRIRVKASVPEGDAVMPTVTDLWRAADWAEREVFDLYGVHFTGHPNLKRILCHHQFKGHALRKDYFIADGQWCTEPESLLDEIGAFGENPLDGGFSELIPINLGPW